MIETPERYKQFLRKVGGLNDFGEPSFILIWGENRTIDQLAIPQPFLAPYFNCWILAKWESAEEFGSPSEWPRELGEYPSRGGYVPLAVFRTEKREPIMLDTEDLNIEVLHLWIYKTFQHEHDNLAKRRQLFKDTQDAREEAKTKRIAELLEGSIPAFIDVNGDLEKGVSFSGQRNCNPSLRQKMEEIERRMPYVRGMLKRLPKRTSIHKPELVM